MQTTPKDERSKKVQETLDRARELLSQADELRQRHAQLRVRFPADFEPGAALAWMQQNAKSNLKVAQALEEYETWLKSRPVRTAAASRSSQHTRTAASRRQWQAI